VNQYSSFKDFIDTKPPIFREADEPLHADEWLNTIEQMFSFLRVTEGMKASYAGHQLQGAIGIWWNHHKNTFPTNVEVIWDQFKTAFRGHYIPPGTMEIKHTEFVQLTQGNKSVNEYIQAFNNLTRYAPEMVDTDAKKIASFKRGLSSKIRKTMGTGKCDTFNEYVSNAITQENNNSVYSISKGRKRTFEVRSSQSKAPMVAKTQYRLPAANIRYRPPQKKNQAKTGFRKGYTVSLPKNASGQGSSNVPPANRPCWNCNKITGLASVPILPSRLLRQTSVRGVFTVPLLRKFLLEK
jgi:hypothetical protein